MKPVLFVMTLTFALTLTSQVNAHNIPIGPGFHPGHWNSNLCVGGNYKVNAALVEDEVWIQPATNGVEVEWDQKAVWNGVNLTCWTPISTHPDPGVKIRIKSFPLETWAGISIFEGYCCPGTNHQHFRHIHNFLNAKDTSNWANNIVKRVSAHEFGHALGVGHVDQAQALPNFPCTAVPESGDYIMDANISSTASLSQHTLKRFYQLYSSHDINGNECGFASMQPDPDQPKTNAFAVWEFQPESVKELTEGSSHVVVGIVIDVAEGPFREDFDPTEPDHESGFPTELVTVEVLDRFKGESPDTLMITRTGGMRRDGMRLVVSGDPDYEPGERLLLYLNTVPGDPELYHVVGPAGRYLVTVGNQILPVTSTQLGNALTGTKLDELIREGLSSK